MGIFRLMKKIFSVPIVLTLIILGFATNAYGVVSEGDLAIVGVNFDTNEVAVVALADISAGETVFITDQGWNDATNLFTTSTSLDGVITWTTPAMSAGDIITFQITAASTVGASITGGGSTGAIGVSGWTLFTLANLHGFGSGGDTIIIYQGSPPNPTFVFAFNGQSDFACNPSAAPAANSWCAAILAASITGSTEPESGGTPLSSDSQVNLSGANAVGQHQDNNVYNGATGATDKAGWLTRISTETNWSQNDTTAFDLDPDGTGDLPAGFSVTPPQRTLTVDGTGTGNGTTTGTGFNCTSTAGVDTNDCSETVSDPTVVILTATASAGSTFTSWSGCDSAATNVCTQTVSGGNETVQPNFELNRTLTVDGLGTGNGNTLGTAPSTINCDSDAGTDTGTCVNTVSNGTIVILTATADPGSFFNGWTGCDSVASNVCTQTVSGGNETVQPEFSLFVDPTFEKAFSPNTILVGETSTLTFTITNPNAAGLTGLNFTDALPTGVEIANPTNLGGTCGATTFSPAIAAGGTAVNLTAGTIGASTTCTIFVDVTATTGGAKNNTAMDIGSTESGAGTDDAAATLTVNTAPEINVERPSGTTIIDMGTDAQGNVPIGVQQTLTYTVRNTGSATLNISSLVHSAPANVSVINLSTNSFTVASGGGTATVTVIYTVTGAGAFSFEWDISSDDADEGTYDITVSGTGVASPDLTVAKSNDAAGGQIESGTLFTWTITVSNIGNAGADFSNGEIFFIDNLPAGATYGSINVILTNVTTGPGSIGCVIAINVMTCTVSGAISLNAGNGEVTIEIPVTPTITSGTLTNPDSGSCEVDPDDEVVESNESNNDCNSDSEIVAPAFAITAPQTFRLKTSFDAPMWCGERKQEFTMGGDDFVQLEQFETQIEIVYPQKRILGVFPVSSGTANLIQSFTTTEPSNFQSPGPMSIPIRAELESGKTIRIDCSNILGLPTLLDDAGEIDQFLSQAIGGNDYFHGSLNIGSDIGDIKVAVTKIVRSWSGVDEGSGIDFKKGKQTRQRIVVQGRTTSATATTTIEVDIPVPPFNMTASVENERQSENLKIRVLTTRNKSELVFSAQNTNTTHMQVEIYGLNGKLIHDSGEVRGTKLRWNLRDQNARPVANGVYLYVVTVRGPDGMTLLHSTVKKMIVLR